MPCALSGDARTTHHSPPSKTAERLAVPGQAKPSLAAPGIAEPGALTGDAPAAYHSDESKETRGCAVNGQDRPGLDPPCNATALAFRQLRWHR